MDPARLRPLLEEDLGEAAALLERALPLDGIATVAEEKLFGGNGARTGRAIGAACPRTGRLLGVLAQAGRWIKVLAVEPQERGRGVGGTLLEEARRGWREEEAGKAVAPRPLRIGDHPGNYLSPGLDGRYAEGQTFLLHRGFRDIARVQNLRATLLDNPLVTEERARALADQAAALGYSVRRVSAGDAGALLSMVEREFAAVWAVEIARAIGAGNADESCVHAAFSATGDPVAFAAHDGNNRGLGWFGPMGTLASHRGKGLGETLLLPCLLDVRDRPEGGVIAWVGPVEFYRRACGAKTDREFIVYEDS